MDSGLLYGVFNTGPWLAYKTPGSDIRGWVGAGKQMFDFKVRIKWKHCKTKHFSVGVETHLPLNWQTLRPDKSCGEW